MELFTGENTEMVPKSVVVLNTQEVPKAHSFNVLLIHHDSHFGDKDNLYLFVWIRKEIKSH